MRSSNGTNKNSDSELVRKAKQGDRKAFSEIVRRNEQMVYSFAFKVCRDKEYAEETLQDTFVNMFRKLDQFDGKSKFSTWIYSITSNCCLMKRRKSKLEKESVAIGEPHMPLHSHDDGENDGSFSLPVWKSTPLDETMTLELRQLLDNAIQKLPVDYRLVFILKDVEGHSNEETAAILKLSLPAVKSRLRRARVFLREQLQEYMIS